MPRLLRPLTRAVTYTRWLHLCIPISIIAIWLFIDPRHPYVTALLIFPVGFIPAMRSAEGLQAQFLLTPDERGQPDTSIASARSTTWADLWRTVAWLELRLLLAGMTLALTVWLPLLALDLILLATGQPAQVFLRGTPPQWWFGPVAPLLIVVTLAGIVGLGALVTALARLLLGPSRALALIALQERNEQLLERTRMARELHDSIGHALTITVMQAGAARAANDPAFTDRALCAIEDTGRAALEDLDRVLGVLRESAGPASQRPTLKEAERLLDSARSSGATVTVEVVGRLAQVPVAVSQEGYRILQEALTNVLRHCGPVPVDVRIAVTDRKLELNVTNPYPGSTIGDSGGSGLRGIRERAALLGGDAQAGPGRDVWQVSAQLPLQRNAPALP